MPVGQNGYFVSAGEVRGNDSSSRRENLSGSSYTPRNIPGSKQEETNDNSQVIRTQGPLRAVIMDQEGKMTELWLPEKPEGRYRFDNESSTFPVYIEAVQDRWHVITEQGFFFVPDEDVPRKVFEVELSDHCLLIVKNAQNYGYTIYVEMEKEGDNVFIPYWPRNYREIQIGRYETNDIVYDNSFVSRHHAFLRYDGRCWSIIDNQSTNGVYVNGRAVLSAELKTGDIIYIMGLRIIMGIGYFAINNGNGRIFVDHRVMEEADVSRNLMYAPPVREQDNTCFNRLPRRRTVYEPSDIEIEGPPSPMSDKMPLLLRLGSPLISGGRAIATGNIFSAVSSMLMPLLTQGFTEKDKHDYEAKRNLKYSEYLHLIEVQIAKEKEREHISLVENYPSLRDVLRFADDKTRLWERKMQDPDFLSTRIGIGNVPMMAKKSYPKERFQLEEDSLEQSMRELGDRIDYLKQCPVLLPLRSDFVVGILGETAAAVNLMESMIIQLVMTHSYDEVKLVVLLDENVDSALTSFAPYLNHFWDKERDVRFIARTKEDAQQLSKELNAVWETYNTDDYGKKIKLKSETSYVIFAQSRELYDSMEVLKDIAATDEYKNFSIITAFDNPPKECRKIITLGAEGKVIDLAHPEVDDIVFAPEIPDEQYAMEKLHKVMNTHLWTEDAGFSLPTMITFLDMFGVNSVEHLNPLRRWKENNPIKSLAAPIGIGTDGKTFTLDLHEKKQGPHGLVAGSTGSGKSEFIITYLLSMAVNYSPDEVAFVLIDYKGGGLADAFVDKKRGIHLPHVVGTITNLDGSGINRSLASINSELKRRQALFSRAKSETGEGTMDIYDYQRLYRQKRVKEPLPHLFIVSDEFAELKKQQPEFMDELISTARIGRSLGVHLILATQKPSGVVNDQIWSNTKFRVCLKVADKSDSYEMLKRYEAAELKNTGRFYLQVGFNELFALGQSAWCGAPYEPGAKTEVTQDFSVQFLNTTGQVVLDSKLAKEKKKDTTKQIVAIVQYLSDLAKREKIVPRMLWKEPLPKELSYEKVRESYVPNGNHISALIGMADDPERQSQYPYAIDLQSFHNMVFFAPTGAGKSTFLRTLLYSVSSNYSPEQVSYYLTDLSGGALRSFRGLPHCSGYLGEGDEAAFGRLMSLMRDIAAKRKALFAANDVTSYDAYLEAGEKDHYVHMEKMPLILFIVDSFQNIMSGFVKGSELYANFNTFMAEISAYGIRVILTVSHSNEVSTRTKQEVDYRAALNPKDRYEAAEVIGGRPKSVPPLLPGRGMCMIDGRPLEMQVASFYFDRTEQEAIQQIKSDLEKITLPYADVQGTEKLPDLNSGQTYRSFCEDIAPARIPLGYHIKDMKKILLPLKQFVCLPVYFGNPNGVRPVLSNFLYAAQLNQMQVHVVRKNEDSQFGSQNNLLKGSSLDHRLYYSTEEDIDALAAMLNATVMERNALVNEYSDLNGIPRAEKGRARKASNYIRERTKSILIVFESFNDFTKTKKSDQSSAIFSAFLSNALRGYNIYFLGCYYPEDYATVRTEVLHTRFIASDMFMLFGGRYHQQSLSSGIPSEYRRIDKPVPSYDLGILRYQESWYDIQMPCGKVEAPEIDPDDAPII